MKIGIVSPVYLEPLAPYVAGGERLPKSNRFPLGTLLVESLLQRGHQVSLFTLDDALGEETLKVSGENLTVHVGGYRSRGYVRAATQFGRERTTLECALRSDPCDVLHAHWSYEFALAALAVDPAALVTVRDWAPLILQMQQRLPDRFYRWGRLLMNNKTLAQARNLTSASPYIARLVEAKTGKPCKVIPNALPDEHFSATPRERDETSFKLISINNGFDRRKNVTTLLESFKLVRQQLPEAELVLVGSGYEADGAAATWAKERDLTAGLTLLGSQPYDRVHALLGSVDLLVHPSLEESFGMTLVEAMAKRVPVVGGRESGAVPWVLAGGDAGVLTDVTSPEALAKASVGVLGNPGRWQRVSAAGFDHAAATFKLSATVSRYLDSYEKVHERAVG